MTLQRRFLPSLGALSALEALDRLGSATAVADELSLTQSAISRQLQSLEQQLGVSLFSRERKTLQLTPAAKTYVKDVRAALTQITRASMQLQVAPGGGGLKLAMLPSFGMRWLVPRLPDFAQRYPSITVNLSTRLSAVDFSTEPFDAAIQYGTGDWPGCLSLRLREERVLPVCAPSLLKDGPFETAERLSHQTLLHIETRPQAWSQWLDAHEAPPPQTPGTMLDQYTTIHQAALHGLGIGLLPDFLVEQDIANGRLRCAYGTSSRSQGDYYLVWPIKPDADPALQDFREWLATQAEDEDYLPR